MWNKCILDVDVRSTKKAVLYVVNVSYVLVPIELEMNPSPVTESDSCEISCHFKAVIHNSAPLHAGTKRSKWRFNQRGARPSVRPLPALPTRGCPRSHSQWWRRRRPPRSVAGGWRRRCLHSLPFQSDLLYRRHGLAKTQSF